MFDPTCLPDGCQPQTSPCFEGRCDCPRLSGMDKQSPTPPLSRPSSAILTACDRDLVSPPELSPLWTASNGRSFKRDNSELFAADLQRALINVESCPQPPDEELRQYITIRDIQPSYYETSPPQFFQYPTYLQTPSYVNYQSHPFVPFSPATTTVLESPAANQFSRNYIWPATQDHRGPFDKHRDGTCFAMSPEGEEDDALCDKPYARLIYDALMQAPGHRMMLREIYDWFQNHTSKPAESGTNGWQNSIRHNLSMNQAFENDKSDLRNATGQKQKVNSVWVLTENAIKNGVQSTTRYRKTGSGKRMNNNKTPAPLRQRSGAKGGRAARRAAQLRKQEHHLHHRQHVSSPLGYPQGSMYDYQGSNYDGADSSDTFSVLDPATPLPEFNFGGDADYQLQQYCIEPSTSQIRRPSDPACIGDPEHGVHDYGYQSASELTLEDMLRVEQDSTALNMSV